MSRPPERSLGEVVARSRTRGVIVGLCLAASACSAGGIDGTAVRTRFGGGEPYDAPFPGEHARRADGGVDVAWFPNPRRVDLVERIRRLLDREATTFGLSSAVFFALDGALDESGLPPPGAEPAAAVFLTAVDPSSPDHGRAHPVHVAYAADGGPFGAPHLLSVLPVQGFPLRPRTRYAAVIRRSLRDTGGAPLGQSEALAQLLAGDRPQGLPEGAFTAYQAALEALALPPEDLAGLTVFDTGDPAQRLSTVHAAISTESPPVARPFTPAETFADYCVYHSSALLPVFQSGAPPYTEEGGAILFDAAGRPLLARQEEARLVLTIPRRPAPAAGYPLAVFVRTGGGGDRPLVDRGAHGVAHGPALIAGSGPALSFARAGWAGLSVDGPLGGPRNPGGGDEQFAVFNVFNPEALRDNLVQSAAELSLLPSLAAALEVPTSTICGGGVARFDVSRLTLVGHSMGATIAPLALAIEPRYRAAVLSGAGGSWIENIVHKESPLFVRGLAELLLGYPELGRSLTEHDPVLSLFQWAGEAADPPLVAGRLIQEPGERQPVHVLMLQGIRDSYILPPIALPLSAALGLDPAEPLLEPTAARWLGLSGRAPVTLPAAGNRAGTTAVLVQHAEDGIEDGHEIMFQRGDARRQVRCFLESFAEDGVPQVVPAAPEDQPCR